MRILVIDDQKRNQISARETLRGHEIKVLKSIKEAFNFFRINKEDPASGYDALLTDLWMPRGDFEGYMNTQQHWKPADYAIPAGLVFALKAVNLGIRTVLCTDSDHHKDWICALLDLIWRKGKNQQIVVYIEARYASMKGAIWDEEKQMLVMSKDQAPCQAPRIKDWKRAMEYSKLFPELTTE